jgi:hypothetical protein
MPRIKNTYNCECCDFEGRKSIYERHILTKSHKRNSKENIKLTIEEKERDTEEHETTQHETTQHETEYSLPYISIIYNELFKIKQYARDEYEYVRVMERAKREILQRCRNIKQEKWEKFNETTDYGYCYSKWRTNMVHICADLVKQ